MGRYVRWSGPVAVASAAGLALAGLLPPAGAADTGASSRAAFFNRTATYPVFQNLPAGADPAQETVAEISAVSQDGRTLIYTCLLYTSPSPRDQRGSRMPSSA